MPTVVHDNFRNAQLGTPGGSTTTVDFDADELRVSLLDQTDSGAITASTSNYGEVDTPTVVANSSALGSKTVGVVATGVFDAGDVTFSSVTGDAADYLPGFRPCSKAILLLTLFSTMLSNTAGSGGIWIWS